MKKISLITALFIFCSTMTACGDNADSIVVSEHSTTAISSANDMSSLQSPSSEITENTITSTASNHSGVSPVPLKNQISLDFHNSSYIDAAGSLYLWGNNEYGQLGDGTCNNSNVPIKILENVIAFSQGSSASAAVTADGSLYTWGCNDHGQLGDGTYLNRNSPVKIMEDVVSVTLGAFSGAAITKNGSLYMWGNNNTGALGDGTKVDRNTPVKIMNNVSSVSFDNFRGAAITQNGDLYVWGDNYQGILCDGSAKNLYRPVKIMENIKAVSLYGNIGIIAVVTNDGDLYMWGDNFYRTLGDGTDEEFVSSPHKIMENVSSVSVGMVNTAAIDNDGDLYMWGNYYTGDGSPKSNSAKFPTKIMDNVSEVSLGARHYAVIKNDGSLYLCGENYYGELGNGVSGGDKSKFDEGIDSNKLISITMPAEMQPKCDGNNPQSNEPSSNVAGNALYQILVNDYDMTTRGYIGDFNSDGINDLIVLNPSDMNFMMYHCDSNGNVHQTYFGYYTSLGEVKLYDVTGQNSKHYFYWKCNYAYKSVQGYYDLPNNNELDIGISYEEYEQWNAEWTLWFNNTEIEFNSESVSTFYGETPNCSKALFSALKQYDFQITQSSKYKAIECLDYETLCNKIRS